MKKFLFFFVSISLFATSTFAVSTKCCICSYTKAEMTTKIQDHMSINCPVCGVYEIHQKYTNNTSKEIVKDLFYNSCDSNKIHKMISEKEALLKHCVKFNAPEPENLKTNAVRITNEWCKNTLKNTFPTPTEQIDYLIIFLANEIKYPGAKYVCNIKELNSISTLNLISATASIDKENLLEILNYAQELGLIYINKEEFKLTLKGWQKYEYLKKHTTNSRIIFMAMKFDNAQKDFLDKNLKPVIEELGFQLNVLTDIMVSENNIDLKLRNAIRNSCLLICDLTHRNNGAYFEAGFAEGLGKPVIYICEQTSFSERFIDPAKRIHFDVEHQEFYMWKNGNEESIKKFQDDLKEKIKTMITVQ